MRIVRLMIHGRVHGVGFRAFVEREARTRGLSGWVRNRRDGSVEAVIAGSEAGVGEMIEACGRGPSSARVDWMDTEEGEAVDLAKREAGETFSVLQTF